MALIKKAKATKRAKNKDSYAKMNNMEATKGSATTYSKRSKTTK